MFARKSDAYTLWPDAKRCIAALLGTLSGLFGLAHQAGAAASDSPPYLSDQEINVAYAAANVIGALEMVYISRSYTEEAAARDAFATLQRGGEGAAKRMGFQTLVQPCFAIPAVERTVLLNSIDHKPATPFQMGGKWWVVLRTGTKFDGMPPLAAIRDRLLEYVLSGAIPDPDLILKSPPLAIQFKAGTVSSVETLRKLPGAYDVDMILPNGNTLLIKALYLDKIDLVTELLTRGANPNKCAAGTCPLQAAMGGADPLATVKLLLDHGADPDSMDRSAGVRWTPLVQGMFRPSAKDIAEVLLKRGANVDGKDGDVTPLMMAAERGNRDAVTVLQQSGADWFRKSRDGFPARNAVSFAATGKGDAAFKDWVTSTYQQVAAGSGRFAWDAWIEQGAKHWHVGEGAITLERKPFDIVVAMRPEEHLIVAASSGGGVFEEFDRGRSAGKVFSVLSIAADAGDGTSHFLVVNPAKGDGGLYGVHAWSNTDGWKTFSAVRADGQQKRYVRTITELIEGSTTTAIAKTTDREIDMVLGTELEMAFPQFDYFQPKRVQLHFK